MPAGGMRCTTPLCMGMSTRQWPSTTLPTATSTRKTGSSVQDKGEGSMRGRGKQGARGAPATGGVLDHVSQLDAAPVAAKAVVKLDGSVRVRIRISLALPSKTSGVWPFGRTLRVLPVYVPQGHYVRGLNQVVPLDYVPPPNASLARAPPRLSPLDHYRVRHSRKLLSSLPPTFDGRFLPPPSQTTSVDRLRVGRSGGVCLLAPREPPGLDPFSFSLLPPPSSKASGTNSLKPKNSCRSFSNCLVLVYIRSSLDLHSSNL